VFKHHTFVGTVTSTVRELHSHRECLLTSRERKVRLKGKFRIDVSHTLIFTAVNKIIDKNQMPQEWETGMVINIHKK